MFTKNSEQKKSIRLSREGIIQMTRQGKSSIPKTERFGNKVVKKD